MNYGFIIDNRKCIGCHACTVACKAEHDVPLGVNRTWVKYVEKGTFPHTDRAFSVLRCNHCADAPCVTICPVTALFTRPDGIVDFDARRCIGCKACLQACPYDALYIDPATHTAQKCNYCAHRIEIGLEPPCVNVCPTHAIVSGDLDDPQSEIAVLLATQPVQTRKAEKGTRPKLYYIEADEASLTPAAAGRPAATMWTDPPPAGVDPDAWRAALERQAREAELALRPEEPERAVVTYRASEPHRNSWGRDVSAYLFTKSIAAGAMLLVAPLLLATGGAAADALVPAGLLALALLAVTNALLVRKIERPERFLRVLTTPQWRSWLTRGAYIMVLYGLVTAALVLGALVGRPLPAPFLVLATIAAGATALYSAFLFHQAKGRDLWQSPVLPLHLLAQAVVAGAAALGLLVPFADGLSPWAGAFVRLLAGGLALNLLALGADLLSRHPTEDAERAAALLVRGPFARAFWGGVFFAGHLVPVALLGLGTFAPAAILALVGLAWFDDLYVRAGQALPLA